MNVGRRIGLISVLALAGSLAYAIPVTVTFVDGNAQVQAGSIWKVLDFDDRIDSAQSVRLTAGAVLELKSQTGSTVTIAAAGTYLVDTLFKPKTEPGAVAAVAGKLEKLASGGKQDVTVAGVRGSEAVVAKETMWAGGTAEADEVYGEAGAASKSGNFAEAWSLYMESLYLYQDASDPTGAARAAYQASLAAIAAGSGAKALSSLRAAVPDDAGALRSSYALALATLSARYGAVEDAKALLRRSIDGGWFDDPVMLADAKSLLSGL